jgi:hypothetical protein
MGHNGSGPPDKFPQWIDLSPFATPADRAIQLGIAYQLFYQTYDVWPTVAVTVGEVVYLGAYKQG